MQFLRRASPLGARRRPSRRTARLVAAADCVSSGSVPPESDGVRAGRHFTPNHTRLAHEGGAAPPLPRSSPPLLQKRLPRMQRRRPLVDGRLCVLSFFSPRPSCRRTALIIVGPIQAVSEVHTGRFHQDKLGSP